MTRSALVVEDADDIRMLVGMLLRREGLDVETADSGEDAIRAIVRKVPDVVVTDMRLPDIDGLQVMASVRALSDVPIVMMTAESGEALEARFIRAGANAFVHKPFDNRELVATVMRLVGTDSATGEGHDNR